MIIKLITILILCVGALQLSAGQIICTTYPVWLLSRTIAAGASDIKPSLLIDPTAGCAHDFTILPGTLRQVARPDTVLIVHGAGVDDHITHQARKVNPRLTIVSAAVPASDVHTFVSPDGASAMADKIASGLIRLYPQYEKLLKTNLQRLQSQLNDLTTLYRALPANRAVLQSTVFVNLAQIANSQSFKLKENHTEIISAHKMRQIIRRIRREKIPVIWCEKNTSDPAVETILKNTPIRRVELDALLTGPADPPPEHLQKIMRNNYDAIKQAVQK